MQGAVNHSRSFLAFLLSANVMQAAQAKWDLQFAQLNPVAAQTSPALSAASYESEYPTVGDLLDATGMQESFELLGSLRDSSEVRLRTLAADEFFEALV